MYIEGVSDLPSKKSALTEKISHRLIIFFADGSESPRSQFVTVFRLTCSSLASCDCDQPTRLRRKAIRSPIILFTSWDYNTLNKEEMSLP